ncbi:MAG: hypothetical protein M0Z75_00665 [Nitrospiraceae bacterium]|nr:hypothetical protein [Nitrospiraceae bacterium]
MSKGGFKYPAGAVLCLLLLSVSGCGGNAYQKVFVNGGGSQTFNTRTFKASPDDCYAAAKKVALSHNFAIEKEDPQERSFTAIRYFPDGKDSTVLEISVTVMGAANPAIYCNAIQYIDKAGSAAQVRQSERTVSDWKFYDKFFASVEKELTSGQQAKNQAGAKQPH